MGKIIQLLLILPLLFDGCHRGGQEDADWDFEITEYPGECFDSLMWQQYHCPDGEEKTAYEWNWAYEVREALGVDDLDSLTTLSRNQNHSYRYLSDSCAPFEINTATNMYAATARFCMLNAYQALAELVYETPLGDNDSYYHDYALWEELFKEFDGWYVNGGSGRGYEVDCYYIQLAKFHTESLLDELAFFQESKPSQKQIAKALPPQWDEQWIGTHPAIQNWYNHRMKMAQKIHRVNLSWAQCIRALTYKQAALYTKFEIETEKEYRYDDAEE